jgi:hypothetical protein
VALLITHVSNQYVRHVIGVPVGDLFLSHLPVWDVDNLIVQGALLFTFVVVGLLLWKPRYILFTAVALALFFSIRAFFISLTHLGVDPHEIVLNTHSIGFGLYNLLYNVQGDFFFSAHTGFPFLMGLIFRHNRFWGKFFFVVSAIAGATVLIGHIHYSIDVFAAPFMTYGIFAIARKLFPQEYYLTIEKED